ncbi:hypothetical protein [Limosilactobacillus fermentum]
MLSDMIPTGLHASEMAAAWGCRRRDWDRPGWLDGPARGIVRGWPRLWVGSREKTSKWLKKYGATDIVDYHNGRIFRPKSGSHSSGVDKVLITVGNAKDAF